MDSASFGGTFWILNEDAIMTRRHLTLIVRKLDFPPIITARVRSTREGNIYTWECLSVHHRGGGVPPQTQDGVPPTWGGVPPHRPEVGYPPRPGTGYPPPDLGWSTPQTWDGLPPPTTCYTAGGMPLAFTQEDFLVYYTIIWWYSAFCKPRSVNFLIPFREKEQISKKHTSPISFALSAWTYCEGDFRQWTTK